MDFSLTSVFVVPSGVALATSGSTQNLTAGQLGIFKKDHTLATTSDTAAAVRFAQGRQAGEFTDLSKKSDFFDRTRVLDYYKIAAVNSNTQQITQVSAFHAKCEDEVGVTLKLFSRDINVAYANGLTRTFIAKAPCCDCDTTPCEDIVAADTQALVDDLISQINTASAVSPFVVASRSGTGASSILVLTAQAPAAKPTSANPYNYQFEYDMVRFATFVTKGAPTSQEMIDLYECTPTATVAVTQTSSYTHGSGSEVAVIERDHYSYQTAGFKDIYWNSDYNIAFTSNVNRALFYDEYVIRFKPAANSEQWSDNVPIDETVRIFLATGTGSGLETLLTAIIGAPPQLKEN